MLWLKAVRWLLAFLILAGCAERPEGPRVLAASSLADVLTAFGGAQISPASSSVLARQAVAGVRADIFVSAHPRWMDFAQAAGALEPGSRRPLFSNRIALVHMAGRASPRGWNWKQLDQWCPGRIALGDPEHVPAGAYAAQVLRSLGRPRDPERFLTAVSARAAAAYIERGEASCGILYKTDAGASPRLKAALIAPAKWHEPIVYEGAVLKRARRPRQAGRWLQRLARAAGEEIWKEHGFEPIARR